jgi:flagella basal body P-ring formation protein FlgA
MTAHRAASLFGSRSSPNAATEEQLAWTLLHEQRVCTGVQTVIIDRLFSARRTTTAMTFLFGALFLVTFAGTASAQTFENLDRLDSLVAASLGANRGEPGGPATQIDRRLRLTPCPQTPVVDAPRMGAATVSCPTIGWRIRVPLTPNKQATAATNTASFAPESAPVVKKGDPVQLVAGNDAFTISRLMIADEDGTIGSLIRVRQDSRTAPVMARVEKNGVVRIPGI